MSTNATNKKAELLYPKLSYELMGICFEVGNKLGTKYQEKHYQRAIEIKLKELNIPCEREAKLNVNFENEALGEFFADFIIDNKIILEIKKIWRITQDDIKQVPRYLKAADIKLGIIVNFKHHNVEFCRVLN